MPPSGGSALVAAARSLRRRRYVPLPVHLCFLPQPFGGVRRRKNLGVHRFIMHRMRLFFAHGSVSTSYCWNDNGISPRGAGSYRISQSWSVGKVPVGQVQSSRWRPLPGASRTCGVLRHACASLYPSQGVAARDGTKSCIESARRVVSIFVEVLRAVSLVDYRTTSS